MTSTAIISTSEGVRYDTSPFGPGKNWVNKAGGLPDFVRAVAHALVRNGHDESGAIKMAIGVIKRWASGGGHVTPKTRAKAVATVAHWEAMKASTGRSDDELSLEFRASGAFAAGHTFEGNQWTTGPNSPVSQQDAGQQLGMSAAQVYLFATNMQTAMGQKVTGQFTEGQLAAVKSSLSSAQAKQAALAGAPGKAAAAKAANQAAAAYKAAAAKDAKAAAADRAKASPVTPGSLANANLTNSLSAKDRSTMASGTALPPAGFNWSGPPGNPTLVPATPLAKAQVGLINSNAAKATTLKTQAAKAKVAPKAVVVAPTKAVAAKAKAVISKSPPKDTSIAHAAAILTAEAAQQRSDERAIGEFASSGPGTNASISTPDSSGAGYLLPNGQPRKPVPREVKTIGPHRFAGSNLTSCRECQRPISDPVHHRSLAKRHAGPGHSPVPSGHVNGKLSRHLAVAKSQSTRNQDRLMALLEPVVTKFFADQRKSTITRLTGKRGGQMLKRASQPPDPPEFPEGGDVPIEPLPPIAPVTGASAGAVNPGAIFDADYWDNQLAQIFESHFQTVGATAAGSIKNQIQAPPGIDDHSALAKVDDTLKKRALASAVKVNQTTRKAIFGQLQEGVVNGEGIGPISDRINKVFDNADAVRARMIAQTETVGALNEANTTYAQSLPSGVVGGKMWLSHHDARTRATHRLADGQIVPVRSPFWVGGYPMQHPGDQTAPPGETINCRCDTAMLPPSMAKGIMPAASLEGLLPESTLKALAKIQAEQADNRKKEVDRQLAAAHA